MTRIWVALLSGSIVLGCGGNQPAPEAPVAEEQEAGEAVAAASGDDSTAQAAPPEPEGGTLPTECVERSDGLCVPPSKWVRRLCEGSFADVALIMMRGDSPWSRGYLRGRTEAVNASGGASSGGWLEFDEEVLLVRRRTQAAGGMQVSGADGYDALRWDGTCVTLSGDEVTLDAPPKKKHSRVEWKWLGEAMQEALRKDSAVDATYQARRKECKGVTMGVVSKKCEQLDQKLVEVIVAHVRDGGELGAPESIP